MIGTWRWNLLLAAAGIVLTLLGSLGSNGLEITALRCLYAFIAFFVLGFLFRALLAVILRPGAAANAESEPPPEGESPGSAVDLSTPDENRELNDMLKMQMEGSGKPAQNQDFQPLSPPKLVSTQNKKPEELAKAIRHLTGE